MVDGVQITNPSLPHKGGRQKKNRMQRQLKFKAWDVSGEYFKPLDDDDDYFFRDDGRGLTLCDKHGECKNIILLQWTGLKDKNGKEIYEGDIISVKGWTIAKIVWNEAVCSFQYSYPNMGNHSSTRTLFDFEAVKKYEVIGNIYEAPELFTPNKENN